MRASQSSGGRPASSILRIHWDLLEHGIANSGQQFGRGGASTCTRERRERAAVRLRPLLDRRLLRASGELELLRDFLGRVVLPRRREAHRGLPRPAGSRLRYPPGACASALQGMPGTRRRSGRPPTARSRHAFERGVSPEQSRPPRHRHFRTPGEKQRAHFRSEILDCCPSWWRGRCTACGSSVKKRNHKRKYGPPRGQASGPLAQNAKDSKCRRDERGLTG
jgi:hypothetical protein